MSSLVSITYIKLDYHCVTEKLSKVVLNTIDHQGTAFRLLGEMVGVFFATKYYRKIKPT
jgi:hypothetical protein